MNTDGFPTFVLCHFGMQQRRILTDYSKRSNYCSSNILFSYLVKMTVKLVLACRTGGLDGPVRCTSARATREIERKAPSQNNPPVVTPLFMLFQPFAQRTVCADWLLYITWSSNVPRHVQWFESQTHRFALKSFAEFNWKCGQFPFF